MTSTLGRQGLGEIPLYLLETTDLSPESHLLWNFLLKETVVRVVQEFLKDQLNEKKKCNINYPINRKFEFPHFKWYGLVDSVSLMQFTGYFSLQKA